MVNSLKCLDSNSRSSDDLYFQVIIKISMFDKSSSIYQKSTTTVDILYSITLTDF